MKAKFIAISAICALALTACETKVELVPVPQEGKIVAYIDNSDTKTAYEDGTKFSWVAGDNIRVFVFKREGGNLDQYTHTAQGDGAKVEFSIVNNGVADLETWEWSGYAVYPELGKSGSKTDGISISLPAEYEVSDSNPMNIIPLVGKQDGENEFLYGFKTGVGVLKVTVSNLPSTAKKLVLDATANLSGSFPLDDTTISNGFEMSRASNPGTRVTISFDSVENGSTRTFYIPVPVGTIPAGAIFTVLSSTGTVLKTTASTAADIVVERNKVLDITPGKSIVIPDIVADPTLVIGEYYMTEYMVGPYSSGYGEPGDIVIEASDDITKGNVMMTKFAGVSGKQYGTFDGTYIVFPKDQIFGANPYDDKDTKPYVALDFYKGSVVDATLELYAPGKIKAVKADAFGLRTCSEDDWKTYGGGWPWAISFSYIAAVLKTQAPGGAPQQIALAESMISPIATETSQGSIAELVDGDISTFWHSPWSTAGTYDSTYGIYIDVDLGEGKSVTNFDVWFCLRSSYNDHPNHVKIYASPDGANWGSALGEMDNIYATYGYGNWINPINCSAASASRYIRISILTSTGYNGVVSDLTNSGCTHMAELSIWSY